jgi:hypothetical protein
MKVTSAKLSRTRHVICPFCESGQLFTLGPGFARCGSSPAPCPCSAPRCRPFGM